MPRILFVKTSSLGDVVHNLPVASDIAAALPGTEIDWVLEESFVAIPRLHPAVRRIIPVAVRRWRKAWWRYGTWRELGLAADELRVTPYDAVLDTQGLLKSALIARTARGRRFGLDWKSSREPLSAFYDRTFRIARDQQAVERNRDLAAAALGYTRDAHVDYGIRMAPRLVPWLTAAPYAVLVHGSSARAKLWPEAQWIAVGSTLARAGVASVLPWGSRDEHARSVRLQRSIAQSIVPPRLPLDEVAAVLAQAHCVVGLDTGLTHLACALGAATVGIYTATDPGLTGLYGCARATNLGGPSDPPDARAVSAALERLGP